MAISVEVNRKCYHVMTYETNLRSLSILWKHTKYITVLSSLINIVDQDLVQQFLPTLATALRT